MNFVRNNYGLIAGTVAGLAVDFVTPIPFLLGTVAGVVYDRKPEWFKMKDKKPKVDGWVDAQIQNINKN